MSNLHQSMSTGRVLTHGVSGFACTGIPGDFQEPVNGDPFVLRQNITMKSYMGAQNHMGLLLSNFNEPWQAGTLQDGTMSAQPYRTPIVGSVEAPPPPPIPEITITDINYPDHIGQTYPQQLPSARIHFDVPLRPTGRQNTDFEAGQETGEHSAMMVHGNVNSTPYSKFFQGASTDNGVHPNNDVANQQTTANTTKTNFTDGQAPYQKLPKGIVINTLQPQEPPPLWSLAPPPDPQVLPGEGTAPLRPTNPAWW